MNVVSDACTIFSGIVTTKNTQLCSFSHYNFLDKREEVVWMHERLISKQIALMCPTWIEISQRYDPPVFMQFGQGSKQHFHAGFALAVWTGWFMGISLDAVIFITIHTCCGREDKVNALSIFLHHFE
jgi:hypothetical protein